MQIGLFRWWIHISNILIADKAVETVKSSSSKYRLKKVRMDLEAEVGDQLERLTAWIDLLRSDHR